MDSGVRNTLFGIAAFISLVLGLLFASVMFPRELSIEQAKQLGYYKFDTPRVVSDFSMTDESGNQVGIQSLQGKWSLLFFGFTYCPDVCPTTLSVLAEVVNTLESPPQVVLVSVDPERDTPETLEAYVGAFHPAFKGYSGSFDETVKLAQQVNIAFGKVPGPEPGTYLVDHSASLVVMDPQGRYAGFIKAPHKSGNIQSIFKSL